MARDASAADPYSWRQPTSHDLDPGTGGPHRISERDLRQEFSSDSGWEIATLHPTRYETRFDAAGARAWLATIERLPDPAGQGRG